jgi:hypothetical protein
MAADAALCEAAADAEVRDRVVGEPELGRNADRILPAEITPIGGDRESLVGRQDAPPIAIAIAVPSNACFICCCKMLTSCCRMPTLDCNVEISCGVIYRYC